jgi:hypothetical protein
MNRDDHVGIVESDYNSYAFAMDFSKITGAPLLISIDANGIRNDLLVSGPVRPIQRAWFFAWRVSCTPA